MCICGEDWTRRRWMWSTVGTSLGMALDAVVGRRDALAQSAPSATALQLLKDAISVDVHSHAGPNGVISRTAAPSDELARDARRRPRRHLSR